MELEGANCAAQVDGDRLVGPPLREALEHLPLALAEPPAKCRRRAKRLCVSGSSREHRQEVTRLLESGQHDAAIRGALGGGFEPRPDRLSLGGEHCAPQGVGMAYATGRADKESGRAYCLERRLER